MSIERERAVRDRTQGNEKCFSLSVREWMNQALPIKKKWCKYSLVFYFQGFNKEKKCKFIKRK